MKALGLYDSETQMFIEEPRTPSTAHLAFLKWLVEAGRLESPRSQPPGPCRCWRCCATLALAAAIR